MYTTSVYTLEPDRLLRQAQHASATAFHSGSWNRRHHPAERAVQRRPLFSLGQVAGRGVWRHIFLSFALRQRRERAAAALRCHATRGPSQAGFQL